LVGADALDPPLLRRVFQREELGFAAVRNLQFGLRSAPRPRQLVSPSWTLL